MLVADLTNPDIESGKTNLPGSNIHLRRMVLLDDGLLLERFEVTNYGRTPAQFHLSYRAEADFADLFEARGMRREQSGTLHQPTILADGVEFAYEGRDGVRRTTTIRSSPSPDTLDGGPGWNIELAPGERRSIEVWVACTIDEQVKPAAPPLFGKALQSHLIERDEHRRNAARVATSNPLFNAWINRSSSDLEMLTIQTEYGPYPAAGAPWYVTTFGRDGIIAALQMIDLDPRLAAGVLRYLAAHQATAIDPETDAAPGKIVHEMREGEMAILGEHRFGRYYGTIDATPLFLLLAGAYFHRTADLELIREIWPNILAALDWIDNYGDVDGDGFVEYQPNIGGGLAQQGWKDSHDSVTHASGTDATPPIALCEVQSYVYAGLLAVARLAAALGDPDLASGLRGRAEQLRQAFDRAFWDDEVGAFALALDGEKHPCRVVASNAGHCLFSGIADPRRAARLAGTFLRPDMSSGWGLRTLSASADRYNPLSYHNGSVWPHDNAIVASGFGRYGMTDRAASILDDTFAAATQTPGMRLPELYCGFQRQPGLGPVRYPISCTPQAWAAGSVFMLLNACLGLEIDATAREITVANPQLPEGVDWIRFEGISIGESRVNLMIRRVGGKIKPEIVQSGGPTIALRLFGEQRASN